MRWLDELEGAERLSDTFSRGTDCYWMLSMSDALTSKPPAFGTHSEWVIHDLNDKAYTMYQGGPGLFPPVELIRFADLVAGTVIAQRELYGPEEAEGVLAVIPMTPPGSDVDKKRVDFVHVRYPMFGPVTNELWYRFPELLESPGNFTRGRIKAKVAHRWELWCTPRVEFAFTAYDRNGVADPAFTFPRTTATDLIESFEARDSLRNLFKL